MLYNGECLNIMDKLIEEGIRVDAIITDPPYGTTACKWDTVIPFEEMWKRIKILRKDTTPIVLFGSEPFSSALRMSNIKEFKYDWIWCKNKPSGMASAKYKPMCNHETITVFYKNSPTYNAIKEPRDLKPKYKHLSEKEFTRRSYGTETQGFIGEVEVRKYSKLRNPTTVKKFDVVPNCKGKRLHPTQKPLDLLEYLIKTYTNEGDTVLDFTMGSGTTGVACKKLRRKFIGIELDTAYFNIAKERIENEGNL